MTKATIEASWIHATTAIPDQGLEMRRRLDPEQCRQLASDLGVAGLSDFHVRYRIEPRQGGRFQLSGELRAKVTQECVVTLEPVESLIDEPFQIEFRPPSAIPPPGDGEQEALSVAEIEPIEQQRLPVGRIIVETLAAALDPYPRAPGAVFEWTDDTAAGSDLPSNPFSVLARLKQRPDDDKPDDDKPGGS